MAAAAAPPRPDALVGRKDSEFVAHTWEDAKQIIENDRLDLLDRWPSDAERYIEWAAQTRTAYGSVTNFIVCERLHWTTREAAASRPSDHSDSLSLARRSETPFEYPEDYKILRNDWPYRWEPGITHICVWLKNRIPVDPDTGKLSGQGRHLIEDFVKRTFTDASGEVAAQGKLLWFKNWAALQSVGALEHFHILVRDVPESKILEWTNMDTTIHQDS